MSSNRWIGSLSDAMRYIFRNPTGSKCAETTLQDDETLYRTIVERGNDSIVIVQDEMIVYGNAQIGVALGYTQEEILGIPVDQHVVPEQRAMVVDHYRRRIAGEPVTHRYEIDLIHKHGHYVAAEINASIIEYQSRPAVLAFIRDMTERKRVEVALQQSEQQFRDMFHKHSAIMYLADPPTLRIIDANHAAEQFYGYTRKELMHLRIPDLNILPEEEIRRQIECALRKQCTLFVFQHRLFGGEIRDVEVRSTPIRTSDGREIYFAIVHDITERKRAEQALQRRIEELSALRAILTEISGKLELDVVLRMILDRAIALLDAAHGHLLLFDPARNDLYIVMSNHPICDLTGVRIAMGMGVAGWVAQKLAPLLLDDYQSWEGRLPCPSACTDHAVLAVPLRAGDQLVGVIQMADTRENRTFTTEDMELLNLFAQQATIAIQNARLFAEVQQLATLDPLTGLYNRRHFFALAEREYERVLRYRHALSVILLDVDNFKKVNDTYGHRVGDEVLRQVACQCMALLRAIDIVGRYGGEEFIGIIPETDLQDAAQVAERLRQQITQTSIELEHVTLSVTVSLGVASWPYDNAINLDVLIDRADQALYLAKHLGKNRVVTWHNGMKDTDVLHEIARGESYEQREANNTPFGA